MTDRAAPAPAPLAALGGRKFALALLAFCTYTILLAAGFLDSAAYVTLQLGSIAAYIAGNGAEHYLARPKP